MVFACPRDNGANVLERVFREGSPSGTGRNANHAITEFGTYIVSATAEASLTMTFGRAGHLQWRCGSQYDTTEPPCRKVEAVPDAPS